LKKKSLFSRQYTNLFSIYSHHQVTSEWTNHQILAGSTATLSLKSNGPSMCAVSATDKAVKFMSGNNNQQTLSLGKVLNAFSPEKESARSGRNSCVSVPKKG